MTATYYDSTSLTWLLKRVEQVSLVAFGLALQLLPALAVPARAEPPRTWPQADVAGASDYHEAESLLAGRKWPEAAIVFRSLLRKNPESLNTAMGLARALAFSGRREESLAVLARFSDRERGARHAGLLRRTRVLSRIFLTNDTFKIFQDGMNLMIAGRYKAARERFETALQQESDNVEILTRIGQCMVMEGDNDSAAERLRLAKRLNPYEPEVRLWLGRAMHQRGELKEALEELKVAEEELEGSEVAPVWLGEALNSYGQRAAAIQVLEQDIKVQPFHLVALLNLSRLELGEGESNSQALWSAKKNIQIALSRLSTYPAGAPGGDARGDSLGFDVRPSSADLKESLQKLLKQAEQRLEELNTEKPVHGND